MYQTSELSEPICIALDRSDLATSASPSYIEYLTSFRVFTSSDERSILTSTLPTTALSLMICRPQCMQ